MVDQQRNDLGVSASRRPAYRRTARIILPIAIGPPGPKGVDDGDVPFLDGLDQVPFRA